MKKITLRKILVFLDCKGLLKWIPDKPYLKMMYRSKFHKKLNIETPKGFNEKLQWLKLYDRKPEYTAMVDKYEAKLIVADRIGEEYVIPTLGVWDNFDDIDFDKLPKQFVLKCTHDSGGLVICRDKATLDISAAKKKINTSLKSNYYIYGREWPYKDVKPRIIAEEYMEDDSTAGMHDDLGSGLTDYKFYCFNGKAELLYVSRGLEDHKTARISFVNRDYTQSSIERSDFRPFEVLPKKPEKFDDMIRLAEMFSADIPFLRVDFYEINGQIYFSEFTFSPCSGMMPFRDEADDIKLGNMIELN